MDQYDRLLYSFSQLVDGQCHEAGRKVVYPHGPWQMYMYYIGSSSIAGIIDRIFSKLNKSKQDSRFVLSTLVTNPKGIDFRLIKDESHVKSLDNQYEDFTKALIKGHIKEKLMELPDNTLVQFKVDPAKIGKAGASQGELIIDVEQEITDVVVLKKMDELMKSLLQEMCDLELTEYKHPWEK